MEEVYVVRKRVAEGASIRRVSREMGLSRNTVKRYLRGAEPVGKPRGATGNPVRDVVGTRCTNRVWQEDGDVAHGVGHGRDE